jgi:hypothetical protein
MSDRSTAYYRPTPGDLLVFRTKKWELLSQEDRDGTIHVRRVSPNLKPSQRPPGTPFEGKIFLVMGAVWSGDGTWSISSLCGTQTVVLHELSVTKYFLVVPSKDSS